MHERSLRIVLRPHIEELHNPTSAKHLPGLLSELGLPPPPPDSPSKRAMVLGSFDAADDSCLPEVAERYLTLHRPRPAVRNLIQDLLWRREDTPQISERTRRETADALDVEELIPDQKKFDRLLTSLFVVEEGDELLFGQTPLRKHINQGVYANPPDYPVADLFERIGAFSCPDERFIRWIEGLSSHHVRPDVQAQKGFVERVNVGLASGGVELRETREDSGYPCYTLVSLRPAGLPNPKSIIFASLAKPGLRVVDVLDNDIVVFDNADKVLVYDRPVARGLSWGELRQWWCEREGLATAAEAESSLRARLGHCLPETSPPQRGLFEAYLSLKGAENDWFPALLPEIHLHWDPKTVQDRGAKALLRSRMDFLMLLPRGERIVIEVDGVHHYAEFRELPPVQGDPKASGTARKDPDNWVARPQRYSETMAADRDLRLRGYEVFRFGGWELTRGQDALGSTQRFFADLFRRYNVRPPSR